MMGIDEDDDVQEIVVGVAYIYLHLSHGQLRNEQYAVFVVVFLSVVLLDMFPHLHVVDCT